jgi:His-Xaa-Ser system protein HxsD
VAVTSILQVDPETGVAEVALERNLYPLDVIYGAAYVLIDRAYLLLDRRASDGRIIVRIESREERDEATLTALVGEFSNELLNQALRRKITRQNKVELEAIVTQALAGATGSMLPGELDDDDLDFLDDPLGIAVPWEEKFSKEARAAERSKDTKGSA